MHHVSQGLSPRARGNLASADISAPIGGSIPACAGQPPTIFARRGPRQVYPRVRGATGEGRKSTGRRRGLSPRARGNRGVETLETLRQRSIPACAGQPAKGGSQRAVGEVYPRVRGATRPTFGAIGSIRGLSPRARGNPRDAIDVGGLVGSIPACAGQPSERAARAGSERVYPRVRGATPTERMFAARATGLSPRARGNRWRMRFKSGGKRSIPACAGQPRMARARPARGWVYPRVRGATRSTFS